MAKECMTAVPGSFPNLRTASASDRTPPPLTWFARDGLNRQGQLGLGSDRQGLVARGEGRDHDVRHVDLLRAKKPCVSPCGPTQLSPGHGVGARGAHGAGRGTPDVGGTETPDTGGPGSGTGPVFQRLQQTPYPLLLPALSSAPAGNEDRPATPLEQRKVTRVRGQSRNEPPPQGHV